MDHERPTPDWDPWHCNGMNHSDVSSGGPNREVARNVGPDLDVELKAHVTFDDTLSHCRVSKDGIAAIIVIGPF